MKKNINDKINNENDNSLWLFFNSPSLNFGKGIDKKNITKPFLIS